MVKDHRFQGKNSIKKKQSETIEHFFKKKKTCIEVCNAIKN